MRPVTDQELIEKTAVVASLLPQETFNVGESDAIVLTFAFLRYHTCSDYHVVLT